jgi:abortive infection bacteriophage resistance protein
MPGPYNLPHLTFEQQVAQLVERGLAVHDPELGAKWLGRIGYYRLRPYWLALRDESGGFRSGASLGYAVDLYRFDAALRQCLLSALERIEVALRVQVSHAIGRRDVIGHRKLSCLDTGRSWDHMNWLDRADRQLGDCREQWLTDFQSEYDGPVPTWMAVEAWSFGTASKLYTIMHRNDRAAVAKRYMVNHETFASWMRAAATLRNSCAHHNRVWNKPLVDQPAVPKTWEARAVQHISQTRKSQTRVYSMIAVLAHCPSSMGNSATWAKSISALAAAFPAQCGVSIQDAGFPENWQQEHLWP